MFFISKYIYKLIFWLYSQLHINYVTLDKVPKFLGITWIDIGLAMAFVISLILTLVFLFRFTMFKTTLVFGWLTICAFIVAVYNQNYNAKDFFDRFDIVEAVYPKKVYTKTDTESTKKSLKLVDPLFVKSIKDGSIEIYDSYKKDSNSYHIDKRKYVDESDKTVKVSEQNYDAFDEKASEIIKETKLKTTLYYFNESLVHKDNPDKDVAYTVVFKLDQEQVDKAKQLEKQSDENKKASENSEKFFND
jgi:hypothetical protein